MSCLFYKNCLSPLCGLNILLNYYFYQTYAAMRLIQVHSTDSLVVNRIHKLPIKPHSGDRQ
jgi:hypothetical protein